MNTVTFIVRISFCFILSTLIGVERQYRHRMVGLRTNVLVSLGAFMFMCISFGLQTNDQTRIAAQIVSGIGFLGAGVILREGNKIKGLNTAATLWCVAAIGTLTATGLLFEASIGTILVLISNTILRFLSQKLMEKVAQKEKCIITITCKKRAELVIRTTLTKEISNRVLNLVKLEKFQNEEEVKLISTIITTRPETVKEIVNRIGVSPDVMSISWECEKYINSDNEDDSEEDDSES